ncbi:E3 ubiquitin-protein ligase MARCH6 [Quillaja saponaria]|uniref:RING-type E3 ubiquitin transferase n=1 Tax=Quillaja saponaria TaxID=32244 RepID=A0AAD7P7B1_QUISA|nr:E3 ubiquitin-protein ligase MARCH6 [Quillaja saponaria]
MSTSGHSSLLTLHIFPRKAENKTCRREREREERERGRQSSRDVIVEFTVAPAIWTTRLLQRNEKKPTFHPMVQEIPAIPHFKQPLSTVKFLKRKSRRTFAEYAITLASTENPLRYPCACRGLSNLSTRSVFFAGSNVARFPAARFASTHSCLSLWTVYVIHYVSNDPLVILKLFGNVFKTEAILALLRRLVAVSRHFLILVKSHFTSSVKFTLFFGMSFGVIPMMCGWWFNIYNLSSKGSLIVMLVFLPFKLVMLFAPSVFPLDISLSFGNLAETRWLFRFGIPSAIHFFYPSRTCIRDNQTVEPTVIYGPDNNHSCVENNNEQTDSRFVLRIILLLVLAWMTMLIFNSAMMALPILLGHTLLNDLPHFLISNGLKNNDLHSFTAGICIIRALSLGTSYSIKQVQTRSVGVLFNQIWHCCSTFSKSSALLSIWISVIPVMIGLLVDLVVIVLIWGPLNEVPSFALFWEWVLGSFFLVIFSVLVLLDKKELFVDVVSWRAKYKILLVFGLPQLHAVWVLHEIMVPIIFKLLILLSLPYVFAQGIFPLLWVLCDYQCSCLLPTSLQTRLRQDLPLARWNAEGEDGMEHISPKS